jgi:excisionase family DNA binding protein
MKPIAPKEPEFLTVREAGELVRLSPSLLRKMADTGEFPALYKVTERRWLVRRNEVLAWIESKRIAPGTVSAHIDMLRDAARAPMTREELAWARRIGERPQRRSSRG